MITPFGSEIGIAFNRLSRMNFGAISPPPPVLHRGPSPDSSSGQAGRSPVGASFESGKRCRSLRHLVRGLSDPPHAVTSATNDRAFGVSPPAHRSVPALSGPKASTMCATPVRLGYGTSALKSAAPSARTRLGLTFGGYHREIDLQNRFFFHRQSPVFWAPSAGPFFAWITAPASTSATGWMRTSPSSDPACSDSKPTAWDWTGGSDCPEKLGGQGFFKQSEPDFIWECLHSSPGKSTGPDSPGGCC